MRSNRFAWAGVGILLIAGLVLLLRHSEGTVVGMGNAKFASLVTGIALLVFIGGSMVASRRFRAGTALRHATIWLGAALLLVTVYSYRFEFAALGERVFGELVPGAPIASTDAQGRVVITLRRNASGQFSVRGRIDGVAAGFLIDTGASVMTLTTATAAAAGIDIENLRFSVPVETANGRAFMAPAAVGRLEIGPIVFNDVRAYVAPSGVLTDNLLGVNVLDRLQSYTVTGDEMILTGRGQES
jgi:aspartyl protease family protein